MSVAGAPNTHAARALGQALDVLRPVLDIVNQAPDEGESIEWCRRRGWEAFLLGLSDAELRACEENGLWVGLREHPAAPGSLLALAEQVESATRLPHIVAASLPLPVASLRGVSSRKRDQLSALLAALSPLAERAERVVDVGAGSGHLSRLAAELFQRQTLGVDRDSQRSRAASAWAERRARDVGELKLRFIVADAMSEPEAFTPNDLLIGLHACGELGDRLVLSAASAGADLALISCCMQKIRTPERPALSRAGADLRLRRAALGLTNLSAGAEGVETSLEATLRAREVRFALRRLLRARGITLAPGEEMRGINRRRARAGLAELAPRALAARSLAPPTALEIHAHEREAARDYARLRRLSLPRNGLARLVELAVVLDRAVALEERGHSVCVATFCERRVTPRNLALFASVDATRLPAITGG
jgi:SAM-dependent methyltransferase